MCFKLLILVCEASWFANCQKMSFCIYFTLGRRKHKKNIHRMYEFFPIRKRGNVRLSICMITGDISITGKISSIALAVRTHLMTL